MKNFTKLSYVMAGVSALAITSISSDANAAAFQLKEQSAAGQGNSFAGATASPEGLSGIFFNPAAIADIEGRKAEIGLSFIAPDSKWTEAGGTSGNAGDDAFVPYGYGVMDLSPSTKLGIGVNAPFGLKTEYGVTETPAPLATVSELTTVALSIVASTRVNEKLAIGGGIILQHAEAELSTNALVNEGDDDLGLGFVLGFQYEATDALTLGFNYRSQINHNLEGDATLAGTFFSDLAVDASLPDIVSFGAAYQVSDTVELVADATWTNWSDFESIDLEFGTPGFPLGTGLSIPQNYENSWFVGLGANVDVSDNLTVRTGFAYDQTPTTDADRTFRVPDEDRTWASLGATYVLDNGIEISGGYSHIFVPDNAVVNEGGLSAEFEADVDILSLSVGFNF